MKTLSEHEQLREAQRIIDDVLDNPLHAVNNPKHPLHQQALTAIREFEEQIFLLACNLDGKLRNQRTEPEPVLVEVKKRRGRRKKQNSPEKTIGLAVNS
jgi:hypothetical protein